MSRMLDEARIVTDQKAAWTRKMASQRSCLDWLMVAGAFVMSLVFAVPAGATEPEEFAAMRSAVKKYQDVNVAIADGYIRDPD